VNLPQVDDSQCSMCHIPQGELEFDASIMGAHVIPDQSTQIPGINIVLQKVTNGAAGKAPTVTFTVRDNKGNGIPMGTFTANSGTLSLTMTGPTSGLEDDQLRRGLHHPGLCHRERHQRVHLQPRWHLLVHLCAYRSGGLHRHIHDRRRGAHDRHAEPRHRLATDDQLWRHQPGDLLLRGWVFP